MSHFMPAVIFGIGLLVATGYALGAPQGVERREVGQPILENIPETPPALAESLHGYENARAAYFQDWLDDGSMLIVTRFGQTAQIHRVAFPGIVTVRAGCREAARSDPVSCDGNRILPAAGCFGSEDPKCGPRDEMALMVEGVVDSGMDIEKSLRGLRRLEPLHLALSSPHDLMGVFGAIVSSEASIMRAREA